MNVESFILASVGGLAYELLFWKDLLANEIKDREKKRNFRFMYLFIVLLWIPVCGIISVYLFQDDIQKQANFIIIGFALPSVLKTISSKSFEGTGGRGLGVQDSFKLAAKKFFHVG